MKAHINGVGSRFVKGFIVVAKDSYHEAAKIYKTPISICISPAFYALAKGIIGGIVNVIGVEQSKSPKK